MAESDEEKPKDDFRQCLDSLTRKPNSQLTVGLTLSITFMKVKTTPIQMYKYILALDRLVVCLADSDIFL